MTHEQHAELIQALHDCAAECNHCFDACLQEEDVKMMAQCIRLDRECADICAFLEHAITRNSPFVKELAQVCATICEPAARNATNTLTTMNTANAVRKLAADVQKLAGISLNEKGKTSWKHC